MTRQHRSERGLSREATISLLLGALGTAGVIAVYYLTPGLQPIELLLMLLVVLTGAIGYTQGIVHGVLAIVYLYIATGIAATFYRGAAPYVKMIQQSWVVVWQSLKSAVALRSTNMQDISHTLDETANRDTLAISFILLTVIVWAVLEMVSRASLKDTSLPRISILDNLGGVFVHLVIGVLVATLLFNAVGYGHLRRVHDEALLRPRFNQALYLYYNAQSFWFSSAPPLYSYDLHLLR
jgi:uncharacterized membrane protein required for colicin V production